MNLDIYYSYACRDSYLVFKWLNEVGKHRDLEITWRPFAIQMDTPDTYWKNSWETANSELRGFIAAESAKKQGTEAFHRFHDALEQAIHEDLHELYEEATLMDAARQAGLDLDLFRSGWYDSQLAGHAEQSHLQAIKRWNIFGTPTLVWQNSRPFHLELSMVPPGREGLETFNAVEALTIMHPYVRQLQQTNS